jgi:hydroxyacylglutathione hydrolase
MIQIDALPAFNDNYIWLLRDDGSRRCAVVDPGDAAPVLAWLEAHPGWQLTDILITHHHFDHVGGVEQLKSACGARVLGPAGEKIPGRDRVLQEADRVELLGLQLQVMQVPGHTLDHIAYYAAATPASNATPLLFCGDTLFAAGCGRLFEGTPEQMHDSLRRFAALPAATRVYCTHEYTLSNLRFAVAVEPDSLALQSRLRQVEDWRAQGRSSLPSSIELELATNPFLRCGTDAVTKKMTLESDAGRPDSVEVFTRLRRWKDSF